MKNSSMGQSKKIVTTVTYAALILGSLVMIFPFLWMILTSQAGCGKLHLCAGLPRPGQRVRYLLPAAGIPWHSQRDR